MISNAKIPLFSICIPLYNTEKYIGACLDSVLQQSYSNFEAIIVDDGSTDGGVSIVDEYAIKDSRIHVIHQKNVGLFHARIEAMKVAHGEFIITLDSDDYLEPNTLNCIVEAIRRTDVDIVIYNNYTVYENSKREIIKLGIEGDKIWDDDKREVYSRYICTNDFSPIWRKAIRRSLLQLDQLIHYPRISMGEDWIHSFYPMINARRIAYLDTPLVNYRILSTSMTAKFDYQRHNTLEIIHLLKGELIKKCPVLTQKDLNIEYLRNVAKAIVYNPGCVNNKQGYLQVLKQIRECQLFQETYYQCKNKISLDFRLPLMLLNIKCYKMLYFIKSFVYKLRKR